MYKVVVLFADLWYEPNVKDCLNMPQYPSYKPPKQAPGRDISLVIGEHQVPQELVAEARKDYR